MAVCVCVGVTMNLVTLYDENFDHMGIRTFCMFTVNSNILAGLSMLLCIPYTVDGLRTGYYHLPDWIVVLMHIAVTAVSLTFLVSLFLLAPVKGVRQIFSGSRFFLHGVCPVLSIVTFCCFICSHLIGEDGKKIMATNMMLVERAARAVRAYGSEPATPREAREMMGLPPLDIEKVNTALASVRIEDLEAAKAVVKEEFGGPYFAAKGMGGK